MTVDRRLLVYYEHPDWFRPLFAELDRRGVSYDKVDASRHSFDPARLAETSGHDITASHDGAGRERADSLAPLVFNRMSPSAWKRGRAQAILYTVHYLRWLDEAGIPAVNGAAAFTVETSKALQISILEGLGLDAPRTRVVNHPLVLPLAARELSFPLVVKPNIGGSGAGIVRFDSLEQLESAVEQDLVPPSLDGILLLQEFHPPVDDSIVRIETLESRYLYGIRVHMAAGAGFDLCPADICRDVTGNKLETSACPVGAQKSGLTVEAHVPPREIRHEVERIARASRLDVGGIEYLVSARDGRRYYYDVNALSNFVADPVRVIGFDPTVRLVDALVARARAVLPATRARREHRGTSVPRTQPAGSEVGEASLFAPSHGPIEEIAPAILAASESIVAPIANAYRSQP